MDAQLIGGDLEAHGLDSGSKPLRGTVIGFSSAGPGGALGGAEAVLVDVIEGAHKAGAEIICWGSAATAVPQALADRGIQIRFRTLSGAHRAGAPDAIPSPQSASSLSPKARPKAKPTLWRSWAPEGIRHLTGFLREASRFRRELADVNPDLLIANISGSEGHVLGAGLWSRSRSISIVHASVSPFSRGPFGDAVDWLLDTLTLWSCGKVIHVSAAVRDQWCRRCFFPHSRTQVIYNGIPEHAVEITVGRAAFGVADSDFVFCMPARLAEMKGHRYLFDAIGLSPQDFQGCQVLLCGTGPLLEEIQEECRHPPLGGVVRVLGMRRDVLDIMRASDCILLPSISSENLSLSALEGLMLGKPVIATSIGGMAEAVRNEETGLVIPSRSASALRDAMVRMKRDRPWARQLGARGRQEALQRFTRDRMIAEYVQLFSVSVRLGQDECHDEGPPNHH
jgi:glycosyltransferase involved in cell wall biosynthesis